MTPDISNSLGINAAHPLRWLKVGKMLDSRQRRIVANAHLVYDGARILYVGTEPPPTEMVSGCACDDLSDHTALPGLIEGHSHVALAGAELDAARRAVYQNQDPATLLRLALARSETTAKLGVVAMRDGGDKAGVGLAISRLTGDPEIAPAFTTRVFSPGSGIHRRGRYGAFFSEPIEDHSNPDACVAARVAAGADHVKLVPTGIINFAKGEVTAAPQFHAAEIAEFKLAAAHHHRHLMAHASGTSGIGEAIDGGVDTIEHGFFITPEQLAKMRDRNIAWLPTFAPVQAQVDFADLMGWTEPIIANLRRILENHAHSLQTALALGVNVLVGSDAGSYGVAHGDGLLWEMDLMQAAGMKPLDLLCQATLGNRQALTADNRLGELAAGCPARFILTAHDPITSVAALRQRRHIIFDGQVFDSETVTREGL